MFKYFKFIELVISLQSLVISTMLPVFFTFPFIDKIKYNIELPITWQIPLIIINSLLFSRPIVITSLTIYLILGIFILPIFHQGGSVGYLLTPNFGYLLGIYPMIIIINILNKKKLINYFEFLKFGILAIISMHIIGILYNLIQMLYYGQMNIFFYNVGKYTLGKIGFHFLMLIPISLLIKPIKYIKSRG